MLLKRRKYSPLLYSIFGAWWIIYDTCQESYDITVHILYTFNLERNLRIHFNSIQDCYSQANVIHAFNALQITHFHDNGDERLACICVNSLAPGKYHSNLKLANSRLISKIDISSISCEIALRIQAMAWCDSKPSPEPMSTQIYVAICLP